MKKEKLERHAADRQRAIDRAIEQMFEAARDLAADMYDAFFAEIAEMAKDGVLSGDSGRVNRSAAWRGYYGKSLEIGTRILEGMKAVAETVKEYFSELLERPKSDFDRVAEKMLEGLGYDGKAFVRGGYLHNLMNDTSVERRVKALAISAIRAGRSLSDFKKDLKTLIKGDRESGKKGIVEAHYYTNASTAFSEFERAMSNDLAEQNDLNHALWSGPKLRDTRDFCAKKKGKVFTRKEIMAMDGQQWSGKIPGQSTLISQGGYGCVDSLLWITEEMYDEFKRQGR